MQRSKTGTDLRFTIATALGQANIYSKHLFTACTVDALLLYCVAYNLQQDGSNQTSIMHQDSTYISCLAWPCLRHTHQCIYGPPSFTKAVMHKLLYSYGVACMALSLVHERYKNHAQVSSGRCMKHACPKLKLHIPAACVRTVALARNHAACASTKAVHELSVTTGYRQCLPCA